MIRKARLSDARAIHHLINSWAESGKVLSRSLNYIFEHIREFWVCVEGKRIVACGALNVVGWQQLAEIKSLVVAKGRQRKGIGRELVEACKEEAFELEIGGIFALTYAPDFFIKVGFKSIDRKKLPHKIWSDCVNCSEFPDCSEEAVMLHLLRSSNKEDHPDVSNRL